MTTGAPGRCACCRGGILWPPAPPALPLLEWRPSRVDSFDTIKALLEQHPAPTREQALEIRGSLYDVYTRLMRVREISPTVDYSARLWRLLMLVGLPDRSLRRPGGAEGVA